MYQLIVSASQVLVPLISYPYITRVLGPENLGKINYIDFLSQIFVIIASFGIPFYGVREIARVKNDSIKRAVLIKEMVVLQTAFSIIAISLFFALTKKMWATDSTLYILAMMNIFFSAFAFDWYIQGMEEFRFAAIRTFFVRICIVIGFFIFIKKTDDYPFYLGVFTGGFVLVSIINTYKILQENTFINQQVNLYQHLKPLWYFFLTSSGISIYIYFDTVLLQHITHSNASVGYYTTALKLVKICQLGLLAIGTVLLPHMSYLAGIGNKGEIKRQLDKLLHFIIATGIPIGAGIFILAPEIIFTIAGKDFLPAVPVIRIIAFLPFIIALSNLFCFQTLVPFKKEKQFLLAVIAGCVLSIGFNILLIPSLKESGAAYANLITEVFITLITGVFAYKIIKFSFPATTIIQTVLSTLIFIPLILLVRFCFTSQVLIFFTAIPICAAAYFIAQYFLFKNTAIKEITAYALNIFTSKNKQLDKVG